MSTGTGDGGSRRRRIVSRYGAPAEVRTNWCFARVRARIAGDCAQGSAFTRKKDDSGLELETASLSHLFL